MAFINWGSESPEQLAIRRRFEEQALYEQMVMMAQSRAGQAPGAAGGGGNIPPSCTLVPIFWPTEIDDFNSHTIEFMTPVTNVSRLTSVFGLNPAGHVHAVDFDDVNIYIDLYDADQEVWVNVWGRLIESQNDENVDYFFRKTIDASFVTIANVSALKVWSSAEMDQTFHDFGGNTTDKFILHSECPTACSPVSFFLDTVNWAAQGGDEDFGTDEDNGMNIIEFDPIYNVTRLVSAFPDRLDDVYQASGFAHTHNGLETSKLSIDLWDAVNEIWINVWNHQLDNTFLSIDEASYGYVIGGSISACFPNIAEVTKMKVYVDFPSNQTYHAWFGEDSFKFYGEGLSANVIEFVVNTWDDTNFSFNFNTVSAINFTIDWGDGTTHIDEGAGGYYEESHTYPELGQEYTARVYFNDISLVTAINFPGND
jgi:hypothetical protein